MHECKKFVQMSNLDYIILFKLHSLLILYLRASLSTTKKFGGAQTNKNIQFTLAYNWPYVHYYQKSSLLKLPFYIYIEGWFPIIYGVVFIIRDVEAAIMSNNVALAALPCSADSIWSYPSFHRLKWQTTRQFDSAFRWLLIWSNAFTLSYETC